MCRCTPTILVVENDPETLLSNKEMFEAEGFRVITARNPAEAKERANEQVIHLALIDVRLEDDKKETDLSGLKLAAHFNDHHPSIEKVVTTAQEWERLDQLMLKVFTPDEKARGWPAAFIKSSVIAKEVSRVVRSVFKNTIKLNPALKTHFAPRALVGGNGCPVAAGRRR